MKLLTQKIYNVSRMLHPKSLESLLFYLTLLVSVVVMLNNLLTNYMGNRLTNIISMYFRDGWCQENTESLGGHCFSDFSGPLQSALTSNPWDGVFGNFPPFVFVILRTFHKVMTLIGYKNGLLLYVAAMMISILFPLIHAFRRTKIRSQSMVLLSVITLGAGPYLVVLDRGNLLAIAYPFIYLFIFDFVKKNLRVNTAIYATIFISIKPQLAILLLLLLPQNVKLFRRNIVFITITYAFSFLAYPHGYFANIETWLKSTLAYQNYGGIASMQPVNVSLKSTINITANIFNLVPDQKMVNLINMLMLIFAVKWFWKTRSYKSISANYFTLVIISTLFSGTCFQYYYILIILSLLFVAIENDENIFSSKAYVRNPLWANPSYIVTLTAILSPIALPWSIFEVFRGRGWENISISWYFIQLTVAVFGLGYIFGAKKNPRKSEKT